MQKHHPQYRFAQMMVERIEMSVDLSDIECWKRDTRNIYPNYPYGRKLVQRAIARAEERILTVARLEAKFEFIPS